MTDDLLGRLKTIRTQWHEVIDPTAEVALCIYRSDDERVVITWNELINHFTAQAAEIARLREALRSIAHDADELRLSGESADPPDWAQKGVKA